MVWLYLTVASHWNVPFDRINLALAGLALVDSLSIGTLVIPIALIIMWRRVRIGLMGVYLATIGGAYSGEVSHEAEVSRKLFTSRHPRGYVSRSE
ncbi:hypothetical protein HMPREF2128_07140 [Pseudoglutamicibacter albus DNF00011]|uniref:Uncharacterized protein n=1 Tax=Pseudoglutamicibacter albus DNF00011 TaxID=1401063 RepID=A0A096AGH2_9MICC|nr:hypothetical protein HMPREF2128_07140 [Pseudoglutamicibacter albus DNF00011]